jgi:hypothetical protein
MKLHQDIYKRRRRCIMNGMGVKTDHQSVLDKLIIMEMEGKISLSDEQITSLFVMNFTLNRTIAHTFRCMIKCLAENIVCQSKIVDETFIIQRLRLLYISWCNFIIFCRRVIDCTALRIRIKQ